MSLLHLMDLDNLQDEQQPPHQPGFHLAPQACSSCRKQKRKCDKLLPTCGLCQRIGRLCDYTFEPQAGYPSPDDFIALQQKVASLESLLTNTANSNGSTASNGTHSVSTLGTMGSASSSSSPSNLLGPLSTGPQPVLPGTSAFPSLFFLDSAAFEYERFQFQAPFVRVPPGALSILGSSAELREMIELYFGTVHTYFPIVSKIRLYQHLASPVHEPGGDIALLFFSMKLATSEVSEGIPPQTPLYQDVKSFFTYTEAQNGLTIQLIQALLLISLYELGHSIYPASYMSIGHAARLGHAMGLHEKGAPQMLPRPNTWTEQEERRRVWWAVIILDRFINIGHRSKPFATLDPSLDIHLPTDDNAWDRGQMLVAAPLALSASQTIRAAPFARICQASHLLGKVVRHINDKNLPVDWKFDEALQLHRTTRALAGVLPAEVEEDDAAQRPTLCTSMSICYSALLTLYDFYSCTEKAVKDGPETQLVMQKESIDGISEVSMEVANLARQLRTYVEQFGAAKVSPLIIDSLYQAAANCKCHIVLADLPLRHANDSQTSGTSANRPTPPVANVSRS